MSRSRGSSISITTITRPRTPSPAIRTARSAIAECAGRISTGDGACSWAARSIRTSRIPPSIRFPSPAPCTSGIAAIRTSTRSARHSASSNRCRPAYRDREVRLKVMLDQGLAGMLLFPTLGVGLEGALSSDPEAAASVFSAFNRWLADDWGYRYEGRIFAVPYVPLLDPACCRDGIAAARGCRRSGRERAVGAGPRARWISLAVRPGL